MNFGSGYGGNEIAQCVPSTSMGLEKRNPTTREKLVDQQKELQRYLADITAALEALDKFPEFEQIHNLLTKVHL